MRLIKTPVPQSSEMVFSDIFGSCNCVSKKSENYMTQKLKLVVVVVVFQFHWHFLWWVAGQNTQTQNTQAQNTQGQTTQSPKIPKH